MTRLASVRWAFIVVLVVPLGVAATRLALARDFTPTGDGALTELAVHDIGRHVVLLGPYSRFGFRHPGPLLFYALAPAYRLLGENSYGPFVGALVINALAIGGIVWVLMRREPRLLPWCAFCLALWIRFLGLALLRSDWNPLVTVLPFALFVVLAWRVLDGASSALPFMVGIASFVAQSHVGYLPAVVTVLVFAVGGWAWTVLRDDRLRDRTAVGWLVATVAVGAALWALPAWQQIDGRSGNLGELLAFFRQPHPSLGLASGASVTLRQLGALPRALILTGSTRLGYSDNAGLGLISLAAFAASAVVAIRRRDRSALRFASLVAVLVAVGLISVSRITGGFEPYLVTWLSALSFLTWLSVGVSVTHPLSEYAARRAARKAASALSTAAIVGTLLILAVTVISATHLGVPDEHAPAERPLVLAAVAAAQVRRGRVLVRYDQAAWPQAAGIVLALEKRGMPVGVQKTGAWLFGDRLAAKKSDSEIVVDVRSKPADPGGAVLTTEPTGRPRNQPARRARDTRSVPNAVRIAR